MNIEQDLRDALRRKPAPPDLADRVMATIAVEQRRAGGSPADEDGPGRVLRIPSARTGMPSLTRRTSWLAAAAAAALVATGAAQYYTYRATMAEAERVRQEIQVALRITSEKMALVQEKVERTALDDSAR